MNIKEKKENFQYWLASMDDTIDDCKRFFKNLDIILDFSIESLDIIENWILANFSSKEQLLKDENKDIFNKIVIYVGETFRKNIGGKWKLDIENEKSAYFNLPILSDSPKINSPIAPHSLATACISRNKGNYISTVLKNKI